MKETEEVSGQSISCAVNHLTFARFEVAAELHQARHDLADLLALVSADAIEPTPAAVEVPA